MRPGREPALYIAVLSATLSLLVTLGVEGLSAEQAALIVAAVTSVGGVITAVLTRPIAPAAFAGAVTAVAALIAGYGLEVAPETVGAINGVVLTVLALQTRGQVTPTTPAN